MGDTSVARLQEYATARGQTLCGLLFGNRGSSSSGGEGAGSSSSSSTEVAEDGLAAELALPALPDRKELGLTPKAAAAVEAFRKLMAGLHAAVIRQPLPQALEEILARVGGAGLAWLRALGLSAWLRALGLHGTPARCVAMCLSLLVGQSLSAQHSSAPSSPASHRPTPPYSTPPCLLPADWV